MATLHDVAGSVFRHLPPFQGKARIGAALGGILHRNGSDGDSIVTVQMRDGSRMRLDIRSRTEIWSFWTGEYDPEIVKRICSCFEPDWVVLDIGANIGFYSIPFGRRLKELNGKLYAFEPVKANMERLAESVALNDLQQTVRILNVAVGNEEGTILLELETDNGASTGNAVLVKGKLEGKLAGNTHARIARLDTLAIEAGIDRCDFIKIDIEGAEILCFQGGESFLKKHRPIIYGEFNRHYIRQFGFTFLDVVALTKPWDYRYFRHIGKYDFEEATEPTAHEENILLVPVETSKETLKRLGVRGL